MAVEHEESTNSRLERHFARMCPLLVQQKFQIFETERNMTG